MENIAHIGASSVAELRGVGHNIAGFSGGRLAMNRELKAFLMRNF